MKAVLMVIEDDELDRQLIQLALKKLPTVQQIIMMSDGAEAISYLMGEGEYADRKRYPYPSLILMDLKMPKVNGLEVLEFLKGNPAWGIIPTVVLTASADPDDVKKAYMMGASSYRVKPNNQEDLERFFSLMMAYWAQCAIPEVDETGKRLPTSAAGKLGECYSDEADQAPKCPTRHSRPQGGG